MPQILDAYIRVSRVAGRSGDSYNSPTDQESAIKEWISYHPDVELGKVIPEENVSGGTRVANRRLNELLVRIEQGVSHGIIVYDTSRFGRDLTETLLACRRILEANGRLVGVDDNVDTSEAFGRSRLIDRSRMAEEYLEDIHRRWRRTNERRVAQGKSVGGVPMGYRRRDQIPELQEFDERGNLIRNGRLVVHEAEAELILHAFQLRAAGRPMIEICKLLNVVKSTATKMLMNRTYLGELHGSYGAVNLTSHDRIISDELFAAVAARRGERVSQIPRREWERVPLLKGVVKCGECGHAMRPVGPRKSPTYYCQSKSNNRPCPGCAASVRMLDDLVMRRLDLNNDSIHDLYMGAESAWRQAKAAVQQAEDELSTYVVAAKALDALNFERGLTSRQQMVSQARAHLYQLDDPGLGDEDLLTVDDFEGKREHYRDLINSGLDGDGLTAALEMLQGLEALEDGSAVIEVSVSVERQIQRLRRVIHSVTVFKADPAHRRWQALEERVVIKWKGEAK